MADTTKIAWADATWNPWSGCTKVSEGCENCYMHREKEQYGQDPANVVRASDRTFYAPLKWREPRFIFACSWGDFFHVAADEWRPEAWDVIRRCPQHTWLILTKRPELIADRLPEGWPWPHVALGVTAENQARADERIPVLLSIPAAMHFVSVEPMLGPVDLTRIQYHDGDINTCIGPCGHLPPPYDARTLGWVIAGGESGPNARPLHPDWVRSLRDQCQAAGVPFCFKQWGEWLPVSQSDNGLETITKVCLDQFFAVRASVLEVVYIGDTPFARVGKKRAGRELDGVIWDERPEPLSALPRVCVSSYHRRRPCQQ